MLLLREIMDMFSLCLFYVTYLDIEASFYFLGVSHV